ncbi:manganese catalase family protein [Chitinophaga horti]|uniref:Manganese catalase family protein n=1 Tax=Chitinophaga horti TaxID=2920382 RepID=A0ABY6IYP7_9BACT|nr:manganese catalase family protein [Chitinophaga horti]UYQ91134.1 manganese catalase family protein [Chitinophaga horti]
MFYHDGKLQYPVRVDKPNPQFAKLLQQAIGGVEGEIRVCLQYLFQAWNSRGPKKYRDMLMETGTEEIAHIEMLSTAVALNLEGASMNMKEQMAAANPLVEAVMGGKDPRHILSAGLGAMAADANGVPFNGSWIIATGNTASDMYANVHAEASGRVLATRLYELTDDPGMKDMLAFLIARDAMHQNQWLAVLEDLGGPAVNLPIPNTFPETQQVSDFAYSFVTTSINKENSESTSGRWASGTSIDGKGAFHVRPAVPLGDEPALNATDPTVHAQQQQMLLSDSEGKSFLDKAADFIAGS